LGTVGVTFSITGTITTQTATTGVSTTSNIWISQFEQTTSGGVRPAVISSMFFKDVSSVWELNMTTSSGFAVSYRISYYSS
jgi:Na+-translocating ferredoxin:NAD+ oxidoreductase RnfE subunit